MRWALAIFTLATSVLASPNLDLLMNAAASFSVTINQQLQTLHGNPSAAEFAERTLDFAEAKAAYFEALRAALPVLTSSGAGQEEPNPEIGKFAAALAVGDEAQEKEAHNETLAFFARFSPDPRLEKAKAALERAQRAEQSFRKDFARLGLGGP
jgi:hypothetical protein